MTLICIEVGKKRVFASALDWPGWSRAGRSEQQALEALANAAPRYEVVAREAGVRFPSTLLEQFEVVERLPGSMSTDFGVPGAIAALELEALKHAEAEQRARLVAACWTVFDGVVASTPAELRKGPRGGGRDRDKMVDHVLAAEAAYASKLGLRLKVPDHADTPAVAANRTALVETLRASAGPGGPPPKGRWPARYAARRIAWHVLDHAWEMQDRTDTDSDSDSD